MDKKRFPVFYGGQLMPWSTGTAVRGAGGFVFLCGSEGRDPDTDEVVSGMAAQVKMTLTKIKDRLEEFGTSPDNICHMWYYVKGSDFPDGLENDPNWIEAQKTRAEFWIENGYPELANSIPGTLIGVTSLAKKEMLIEITAIAALPPLD